MKAKLMLAVLAALKENPTLKKYFGEILLRLVSPASPFFKPLINAGAYVAVLSALLVAVKDALIEGGIHVPAWYTIVVACIGSASAAIALGASLTGDKASLATIEKAIRE